MFNLRLKLKYPIELTYTNKICSKISDLIFHHIFLPLSLKLVQQKCQQFLQFRQNLTGEQLRNILLASVLINTPPD